MRQIDDSLAPPQILWPSGGPSVFQWEGPALNWLKLPPILPRIRDAGASAHELLHQRQHIVWKARGKKFGSFQSCRVEQCSRVYSLELSSSFASTTTNWKFEARVQHYCFERPKNRPLWEKLDQKVFREANWIIGGSQTCSNDWKR